MMAKGANGTIDLASFEQLRMQRLAIEARNLEHAGGRAFGIAKDRVDSIFTSSPLLEANRISTLDGARDPDSIQSESGDIYAMYANVVDGDYPINGFGFEGADKVDLNYGHLKNPLKTNAKVLTKGQPTEIPDNAGSTDYYSGFPDLVPNSLDNPAGEDSSTATEGLDKAPANNFGSTANDYRDQQNIVYPGSDQRGTFEADLDNTLGKYFKENYTN
jgi:hypothetical protein